VKKGGQFVREYVKTRARNEALDLEVYNLAALYTIGNWKLDKLGETAQELTTPHDASKPEAKPQAETSVRPVLRPQGGGTSWVKNW
jgi:phage terminase large subunit GpA-like protein